jgi:hypothetical protein
MRVALVGAGNLATNLGLALQAAGHEIVQVYSRTEEAAVALANRLVCPYTCVPEEVTYEAELYVFAVKDSVLSALIHRLCPSRQSSRVLFVHTAGSMPLSVFTEAGVERSGVFYPMQTFTKSRPVAFKHIPIFIECNRGEDLSLLRSVAGGLSSRVYELSSEKRRSLHLAAVFACNFTNHCYARAEQILREQDIPFDVMLPLIDETAAKVHALSPRLAQTGPAVRYDRNVMDRHLALLMENRQAAQEYELLSLGIHDLSAYGEVGEEKYPKEEK